MDEFMRPVKNLKIVLPSLKTGGGVKESLNLAHKFEKKGWNINFISMWKSRADYQEISKKTYLSNFYLSRKLAVFQYPIIFIRWIFYARKINKSDYYIFTHYSTFLFSLFINKNKRIFYVQALEWYFSNNKAIQLVLKKFILFVYRHGRVLTISSAISDELSRYAITTSSVTSIWANKIFYDDDHDSKKDIDIVMVLRHGSIKRLDLYKHFLSINKSDMQYKVCVITPDEDINFVTKYSEFKSILLPSLQEMKDIYSRSRVFLMLSDYEGFGLPPLEAMGSGCVPICRDSGGINAYMTGVLARNVISSIEDPNDIYRFTKLFLTGNKDKMYAGEVKKIFIDGLNSSEKNISLLDSFIESLE
jgi:hypothetical protein